MPDHTPPESVPLTAELRSAVTALLDSLPHPPRLLALGEPTHGVETFPAWRNGVFRVLVEEHGFRSVALESDIFGGQRVNAHVVSGHGALDDVMHTGFSHGFVTSAANRELVAWMRAFNAVNGDAEPLHFYGFDPPLEWWAPSPAASVLALHAFLSAHLNELPVERATLEQLCGADDRWSTPAAVMDAARSVGDSEDARRLRLYADDLDTLLSTEAPHLAAQPGFWDAQLHARTATGLLRYHAATASTAPDRVARLAALRDVMMADNLCAVAEREHARGPTLVFAHNSHLQRPISVMHVGGAAVRWWSAGAHLSRRVGPRYAFIAGMAAPRGTVPPGTSAATLLTAPEVGIQANRGEVPGLDSPARRRADGVLLMHDSVG